MVAEDGTVTPFASIADLISAFADCILDKFSAIVAISYILSKIVFMFPTMSYTAFADGT